MTAEIPAHRVDDFNGDNAKLIRCIDALLDMDDDKCLTPHGLGGKGSHAYRLLVAARHRLTTAARQLESYAAWQQQRGRLPDLIDEALQIYDDFMTDDAYDAQRPLDKIAEKLRSARDFYPARQPSAPSQDALREQIARIVGGSQPLRGHYCSPEERDQWDDALAKADEILALSTPVQDAETVERAKVAALVALAEHGATTDIQELLVKGSASRSFPPGALDKMIRAALASLQQGASKHAE